MDLSYFQTTNEEGEAVMLQRPESKSFADVNRVVRLGKPPIVVDKFIELAIISEQWQWLDEYNNYLLACEAVELFNSDLPVVEQDEDGNDILAEPKILPVEPVRPALITVDEFKALHGSLFNSYLKNQGAEINGKRISLNESNQNGIAAVLSGLKLADESGVNPYPIKFSAESPQGVASISFDDLASFQAFALEFMAARQVFFV